MPHDTTKKKGKYSQGYTKVGAKDGNETGFFKFPPCPVPNEMDMV